MLLSHLKIAWKVLLRRKFFTFISLFGISFTLMILLVVYALYDHTVGPHTPEKKVDRLLFINRATILLKNDNGTNNGTISYSFLERYVRPLRTPERVSISTYFGSTAAYVGNQKLDVDLKYTDGQFWQVLDFNFVAGRPYTMQEVQSGAHVAVINERTCRAYFGTTRDVLGKTIETDRVRYQVIGVVQDVPGMRFNSYADMWAPISTSTQDAKDPNYFGNCMAIVLARTPADVAAVQDEFNRVMAQVPVPNPRNEEKVLVYAGTLLSSTVRWFDNNSKPDDGVAELMGKVALVTLLFMLLPALNLINVNVSRILERSSEIGVRKAFGATSGTLIRQFLVENVFLTLLGGVLGLVLASVVLHIIDSSGFIPYTTLKLNPRIFAGGLLLSLLFGLLSGVYPAYKMSKLHTVQALKGGRN
ncbi:ABC transporter permease [Hymenobacter pini]|uniref:ABC transporter permease n=1 Tax=Hymenobacter pini TaxID=2880879 RepID=UPI001CF15A42|nr:ABC transporter permease [Hymenobacter pini]MCA8830799.1 ABC transporter permease [Hymenobacter pini]